MKIKTIFLALSILFSTNIFPQVDSISIEGEFKLTQNPHYNGFFKVEKNEKDNTYFLMIGPNASHQCKFTIKRITAPQQVRGMNGVIFSNKLAKCNFGDDSDIDTFWNSIELVDISYRLNITNQIEGQIQLNTINQTFQGEF